MILSHNVTAFDPYLVVEYSAARYANTCLVFQLKREDKSASRSNSTNANSVALELLRGALPFMTRKLDTRRLVEGLEGMRYEVIAIHPARTNRTVVRNEKTPFNLCTVEYIVLLLWRLFNESGVWRVLTSAPKQLQSHRICIR